MSLSDSATPLSLKWSIDIFVVSLTFFNILPHFNVDIMAKKRFGRFMTLHTGNDVINQLGVLICSRWFMHTLGVSIIVGAFSTFFQFANRKLEVEKIILDCSELCDPSETIRNRFLLWRYLQELLISDF